MRGTSPRDAGYDLKAIGSTDTRNKTEYDDLIGRRRVIGYAGLYRLSGIRTVLHERRPSRGMLRRSIACRALYGSE